MINKIFRLFLFIFWLAVAIFFLILIALWCLRSDVKTKSYFLNQYHFIAHSMGDIDDYSNTCSLEAFHQNYLKGKRVFEVDLRMTKDGKVVCFNDGDMWEKLNVEGSVEEISYKRFMFSKYYNKYTPLDLNDILQLINNYPDIAMIFDVKYNTIETSDEYNQIFNKINNHPVFLDVQDRIIPQVYNQKNVDFIQEFSFPEIIFSGDKFNSDTIKVLKDNDIQIVSIVVGKLNPFVIQKMNQNDILILTHTVNNKFLIRMLRFVGVYGFFTDSFFE